MPTDDALLNLEGATLEGKYRLVRLLGSGGMGSVYQAEQLGLGRSVAVKVLHHKDLGLDGFRAEAIAASRINHPHAIAIYDFGVAGGEMPFLVMEHLRGRSLASVIEQEAPGIERVVKLGAQVLAALAEAHACGVVHCDLTSTNIIVERLRNGDDFAKVIDFGLARAFGDPGRASIVGTPEYMAPEQIRGDPVGPPADLYAMGVLLYEMLVGQPPFVGSSVQVVLDGHLHAPAIPPHEATGNCPTSLSELIMRALDKEPALRPQSAGQMRGALLAVLGDDQVPACSTCGEHVTFAQRFCGACGGELGVPLRRLAATGRAVDAMGTGPVGKRKARARHRTNRLTCDFDRAEAVLIGRTHELERVTEFCRGSSSSTALAIVGPSGLGKARLLIEARRALRHHLPFFFAGADPSGMRRAWYPILSIIEQLLELGPKPEFEELASAVARLGLPDRDVPGLALLFGIEVPVRHLELAVRRREAHAAALRALASVRRHFPRAVYCFADVDDYDHPSCIVVRALCRELGGTTVRVLLSATDPESLPERCEVFELAPLEPDAARVLAERLTGPGTRVTDSTLALAAGLPAAIEQLAGWLSMGHSTSAPSLLVDLVSARVNRLPTAARRVLQAAAIHGTVIPRWLVEATLGEPEPVTVSGDGWSGLLVIEEEDVTIPYELVAEVVSACTPADVRRALHARALAALEDKATPGILGHHAEHAGALDRAYVYYLQAGAASVSRFDDHGATSWYGRALRVARMESAAGSARGTQHFVDAAVVLASVLHRTGQLGLANGVLDEAEMFEPTSSQRAAMERIRGVVAVAGGDPGAGVGHLRLALGLALREGEQDFLCETYIDLSRALHRIGQTGAAIAELNQGIDVITMGQGMPVSQGPHRLWRMGMHLAERCFDIGELERAQIAATAALEQARRTGSARGNGRLSALLGTIHEAMGDPAAALRHRAHAIDILRELGDRRSTAELLLDSARSSRRSSVAAIPVPELENPRRGLRIARKLAHEIGWREGLERTEDDGD